MKPEQIYQALCELAEKLDIEVSEQNFRNAGIAVNSGLCRLRGRNVFLMDKHKSVHKKTKLLAMALAQFPHEDIYLVPVVREVLLKYAPSGSGRGVAAEDEPIQNTAPLPDT